MNFLSKLAQYFITLSQLSKYITHNEGILFLGARGGGVVLDWNLADPPASPSNGDAYIIASPATGVWSGKEDYLAIYYDGWRYIEPLAGPPVYVVADDLYVGYAADSSPPGWEVLGIGGGLTNFTQLSDVPSSYTSQAGKVPRVNAGETALEFVDGDVWIPIACSDEITALTTGTAKVTFHWPCSGTVREIWAGLTTPQTSGSTFTVDVNNNGSTMLSTKVTIDNTAETSLTAATPPVLTNTTITKGQKATIDIDQVGDGTAKGLKVYIRVRKS